MRIDLNKFKRDEAKKNLYTFYSAKKIYLARTPSKLVLLEKKENVKPSVKSLSLCTRNTVVISKKNGILLFPTNRQFLLSVFFFIQEVLFVNLSFDLYKTFYYVCKYMSITAAAKNMYVSQPAITKQIKNLESATNKTLFIRNKTGLMLTPDGLKLYLSIKESVEKLMSLEENENSECVIKIVAGYSTIKKFLIKKLSKFNEKYPNVKFEIMSYRYYEAIDKLRSGMADLIFLNVKNDMKNTDDLVVKKLCEVNDIFVVSPSFKDKVPDFIKMIDLNKYPIICKMGSSKARDNIEGYFKDNNLEFTPKYELSNNWMIEEYVYRDLGIGLVTREFNDNELNSGRLIEIKTDLKLPSRDICYAFRKNFSHSKIIDEFIKVLNV